MLTIDGSLGEGGGQILRSTLALSAITGTPVRVERIRGRRPKPGLQRQHLVAVQAAACVCGAQLEGDALHSREIAFAPQQPMAGDWRFDIGSAGSSTLVLQTILPILMHAPGPTTVAIGGGTHNPKAPPVEFLQECLLPVLARVGISATVELERHGFYPAGGGRIRAAVQPLGATAPLELVERGKQVGRSALATSANLPGHVVEREARHFKHALHWSHDEVDEAEVQADGPGNIMVARLRFAQVVEVASACGELRKSAEQVAHEVAQQVRRYLEVTAPVGEHLADQLLLPLALAGGGRFRTVTPSEHTRTNADVIARFLGEVVTFTELGTDDWMVAVRGRSG